ncbi:MAG: heparinase II/III domain-containing protein [Gemmataceae bacterium]
MPVVKDKAVLSELPTPAPRGKAARLGLYYRTARHSRWSQLLWRMRYNLERRRKLRPRTVARWRWPEAHSPRVRTDFPDIPLFEATGSGGPHGAEELGRGVFRFLNQARTLGRERPDWRLGAISAERLWTVTLHYHAWAYELAESASRSGPEAAEAATLFRHYLSDWMARCALETPGARDLAWNAYAIATRLIWWIRCHRQLGPRWREWGEFERDFLVSLWQQAAYLRDHLEWDLRANHLMRDAMGLAWAGRFFEEERAREWLKTATRLAVDQAEEQVLADGGHFERSPMYHLHVMEDVFALALLVEDAAARDRLRETWRRMAEFLAWMRHPDGDLALFNDGGLPGTQTVERMLDLGESLGAAIDATPRRGGAFFPDTGLAVWHGEPWTVFFDVGAVGPDYQPGHAHADTLALECSFRGQRLFVDPGTYAYDHDDRRRYDRSTAAHNTVCLDGQDSSEVWHIFRVGRRAYPSDVRVDFSGDGMRAWAAHDGYDRLPGRPRHARNVAVGREGSLTLTDAITGRGDHLVQGGLLLSPEWTATAGAGGWLLENGGLSLRVTVRGPEGLVLTEERQPYHPDYGREVPTTRLSWRVRGRLPVEVLTVIEEA